MSDREQLLAMGFSDLRVARALRVTKNAGLQAALDHLIATNDDPEPTTASEAAAIASATDDVADEAGESLAGVEAEAKSLTCIECGKQFRSHALASYHGEKSGHSQFEESTAEIAPLSEQEKAVKLEELRMRMLEKKKINAKRDAEEAKVNEAIRRKGGQDQSQIKADMELKAVNKEALQRKQDKIDDAKAKAAVRLQIEADKATRAAKAAREKALRDGTAVLHLDADSSASSSASASAPTAAATTAKPSYDTTRLQIRLAGGGAIVKTCATSMTLQQLYDDLSNDSSIAAGQFGGCRLICSFPRKAYGEAEMRLTLKELGLAPSAVLICEMM